MPDAPRLRAWSSGELTRVRAIVDAAVLEWARAWDLPVDLAAPLACTEGDSEIRTTADWHALGGDEQGFAWWRWSEGARRRLASVWFGAGAGGTPVVEAVVQDCQRDAMSRLANALRLRDPTCASQPADAMWRPWSGAATMSLPCGGHLAMQAGVLDSLLRPPATSTQARPSIECSPLVTLGEAISRTSLRLRVELEGCELGLGELQDLQAGDVLRLAHPLDAPLSIFHAPGPPLFRGWLARSHGRKAVELAAATVPASKDPTAKELR
jgi:hypothetical protein